MLKSIEHERCKFIMLCLAALRLLGISVFLRVSLGTMVRTTV